MNKFEIIAKLGRLCQITRAEGLAKAELLNAIARIDDHIAALDTMDREYIQGYIQAQLDCNVAMCALGLLSPDGLILGYDLESALSEYNLFCHRLDLTTRYLPRVLTWPNGNYYC